MLPKYNETAIQERIGVNAVSWKVTKLGLIFRELPTSDVGIDGQVEYVNNDGEATGEIVAIQIKSGKSFFTHETNEFFKFYLAKKHAHYWENFPNPVLLLMHNPENDNIYFTDVRYELQKENISDVSFIKVDKLNVLNHKNDLFYTLGKNVELNIGKEDFAKYINKKRFIDEIDQITSYLTNEELFDFMRNKYNRASDFKINFLELYVAGLTSLGRQTFFNMQVAYELVEDLNNQETIGIGKEEHYFLHKYAKFLLNQNLANIDYTTYLIEWQEHYIQPQFLASLTNRGKSFSNYLYEEQGIDISESILRMEISINIAQMKSLRDIKQDNKT